MKNYRLRLKDIENNHTIITLDSNTNIYQLLDTVYSFQQLNCPINGQRLEQQFRYDGVLENVPAETIVRQWAVKRVDTTVAIIDIIAQAI